MRRWGHQQDCTQENPEDGWKCGRYWDEKWASTALQPWLDKNRDWSGRRASEGAKRPLTQCGHCQGLMGEDGQMRARFLNRRGLYTRVSLLVWEHQRLLESRGVS